VKTRELVQYLDELLKTSEIPDDSLNGLQVEHDEREIRKIGGAVDISEVAVAEAVAKQIDFLIVHHGLYWSGQPTAITGPYFRRVKGLIQNGIALYASHLPLDLHPEFGNNAVILKGLGWQDSGAIGSYKGIEIGRFTEFDDARSLSDVVRELEEFFGTPPLSVWDFGPKTCQKVAVVSGKGISLLPDLKAKGVDLLITGETSHAHYWLARELQVHVVFFGHYVTERYGVIALGRHLMERFGLEFQFLELPTGL